jgi:hypothetical protein
MMTLRIDAPILRQFKLRDTVYDTGRNFHRLAVKGRKGYIEPLFYDFAIRPVYLPKTYRPHAYIALIGY